MSGTIFIEGGSVSKESQVRCRAGFRKLLGKCGFGDRMPRTVACGGRDDTFDDFKRAHRKSSPADFIALLVDSEDTVRDINSTWDHLNRRDKWEMPSGASDEQVLLMTTCMETWIATDRGALRRHYGASFRENALPPVVNMENRHRNDIQEGLRQATKDCSNAYRKGDRSFKVLAELDPEILAENLPSFARIRRILHEKL